MRVIDALAEYRTSPKPIIYCSGLVQRYNCRQLFQPCHSTLSDSIRPDPTSRLIARHRPTPEFLRIARSPASKSAALIKRAVSFPLIFLARSNGSIPSNSRRGGFGSESKLGAVRAPTSRSLIISSLSGKFEQSNSEQVCKHGEHSTYDSSRGPPLFAQSRQVLTT